MSDPIKVALYVYRVGQQASPVSCVSGPLCSPTLSCCYLGVTCVSK